jgi:hypothetical protein
MNNSSHPFRAYFGVLLSVVKDVPVQQTIFSADMVLDTLLEDDADEDGSSSEGETNSLQQYCIVNILHVSCRSGLEYTPSRRGTMTDGDRDPELMVPCFCSRQARP